MAEKKNRFVRNLIIFLGVVLLVAIVGKVAGWWGAVPATEVAVEKVAATDIIETVSASGKIQPEREIKISPDVPGEIVELTVKEGSHVTKGQLLAKIRPDVYEADFNKAVSNLNQSKAQYANMQQQLAQAKAQFINTEATYQRTKKLFSGKVVSKSEFDKAGSDYESAKANIEGIAQSVAAAKFSIASSEASVKESSTNLAKTTIFSPVSGIVSKLNVELGERVVGTSQMAGTEMMRIANLSSMEAQVDVNENDINRISLGDTATISVDAFLNKTFKGTVFEIGSSANSESSTAASADQVTNFKVKIRMLPSPEPFKPGLSTAVEIQTKKASSVVAVPIQAVTTRPSKDTLKNTNTEIVFVVKKGVAKEVQVKTGIQNDKYIQIVQGLSKGDQIVVAPYLAVSKTLSDNQKVKIVGHDKLFDDKKN